MISIEELRIEIAKELREKEKRYLEEQKAAREEEILHLTRIEFRHLLENELEIHLLPYIQINSKNARFILDVIKDPINEEGRIITGHLAVEKSRLNFSLNPRYDGHNCSVYDALDFYPKNGEPLSDKIVQGMRETRDNILNYFK